MPVPKEYDFIRYLAAKKTVDDRALNGEVARDMVSAWSHGHKAMPNQVLEVAAGIGTMVDRLVNIFPAFADYTAVDSDDRLVSHGKQRIRNWETDRTVLPPIKVEETTSGEMILSRANSRINLNWVCAEALEFAGRPENRDRYDLLIAHAFLDLVDLESAVPALLDTLKPGGVFWFTLNYDGLTIFEPIIDPALDAKILQLYDRTMDERILNGRPSGDSRTGRHLFRHLERAGAEILAAGSSDWVVHPSNGEYQEDEAYFLQFIIHTVQEALKGHPELDAKQLADWAAKRHAQVEAGELVYVAHQLDFAGRVPKG